MRVGNVAWQNEPPHSSPLPHSGVGLENGVAGGGEGARGESPPRLGGCVSLRVENMARGTRDTLTLQPTVLPLCVVPEGAPKWVTADLLTQTMEVWQPYYRDPLTVDDALEMLLNVSELLRVLATNAPTDQT